MSLELINEYEKLKWEHYKMYKKFDEIIREEKKKMVNNCIKHIWKPDRETFDLCRTHMYCSVCGAYK